MAKYDTYTVSLTSGTVNKPIKRDLTVLFEDGDTPSSVISAADILLLEDASGGTSTIAETLVALTEQEMYDLMVEVWAEQMSTMGNAKYAYANRLRDAVSAAQNA
jgi:hypothetical protein